MSDENKPTYYRCTSCDGWKKVEPGNHHPWCMLCAADEFDWSDPRAEDPEEE